MSSDLDITTSEPIRFPVAVPAPADPPDHRQGRSVKVRARLRAVQWTALALAVALLGVEAAIVAESWRGLTGFAVLIGITGVAAYGVPITLDGVALVAALLALKAELDGEPSTLYRLTMFAFTAASAAANWWHGYREIPRQASGMETALYLGGMSIATAIMFALCLRQMRVKDRRDAGRIGKQQPKFGLMHWVRYPALTYAAWSLAVRDGYTTPRQAVEAARAAKQAAAIPPIELDDETLSQLGARDRIAVAIGALGTVDIPAVLAMLQARGCPVDQSYAYKIARTQMGLDSRAAKGDETDAS